MASHLIMTSSAFEDMMPSSLPVRPGPPAGHQLRATINKTGNVSRVTVGEKNPNRPNKSILLVGERAAGKPALIDALLNYSLGLKPEHGVWFQVVEEVEKSQSASQTPDVIVYQIFEVKNQTLPFSLTVIDTPGYGDSRGVQHDDEVSNSLLNMFQTRDGATDLHAVGLVMKATDHRVSDRLKYVFNSVVSLFGAGNTVALITHSDGMPPHAALKALEEANITSSKNNKNQSVHFVFNNQKMIQRTQENLFGLETAWRVSLNGLTAFARFLHAAQPNDLTATFQVLAERARLTACVQNLQDRIRFTELKQRDVRLTQEELHKHAEERKSQQLIITVTEAFKDTEPIRTGSSGSVLEAAVCCPVCEENCHYPGCTMGLRAQRCEVMKDGACTSCTNRCPASYHVKDNLKFVIRTRKVQLTEAEVAQTCDQNQNQAAGGIRPGLLENLEKQMQQLEAERSHLLDRAYQHVVQLGQTRPVTVNSGSTQVLLDFLINKMKQKGDEAKVKKLEEMDKKMDDRTRAELLDK
uniref:Septin-type G domain-containing protein n=1 Tax=Poecilia reticulata TaxID=8081 RepID=A0A3P9P8F5_POERE